LPQCSIVWCQRLYDRQLRMSMGGPPNEELSRKPCPVRRSEGTAPGRAPTQTSETKSRQPPRVATRHWLFIVDAVGSADSDNSLADRTAARSRRARLCACRARRSRAIDLFLREEDAKRALEECLRDEGQWAGALSVESIELDEREFL
jgi:hypothetical protein